MAAVPSISSSPTSGTMPSDAARDDGFSFRGAARRSTEENERSTGDGSGGSGAARGGGGDEARGSRRGSSGRGRGGETSHRG